MCGLMYHCCVQHGVVLYLTLGLFYPLLLSCIQLALLCLSFSCFILLLYSLFLLFSFHCWTFVVLLLGCHYGIIWVCGSDSGGCFEFYLVWDRHWWGDEMMRICYAIESFQHHSLVDGIGSCIIGCGDGGC